MIPGADEGGDAPRVLVGVVAKAHGLRGEVVVKVMSDAPERFAPGSEMTAAGPESLHGRPLRVATSRPFQGRLLVQFEGIESREDAETIHGQELTIARSQVAPLPEGRHYQFELVGLAVQTTGGSRLGRVTDIFSTGSNDVLVVDDDEREILIPMLEGVIVSVDLDAKAVVVEPPPGLPGIGGE
jgi:16S rRNA processing protein RimM